MTSSSDGPLFTPTRLGAIAVANRIAMAPLTRNRAIEGRVPNPLAIQYYEQRASAGLIIAEATQISPLGRCMALTEVVTAMVSAEHNGGGAARGVVHAGSLRDVGWAVQRGLRFFNLIDIAMQQSRVQPFRPPPAWPDPACAPGPGADR